MKYLPASPLVSCEREHHHDRREDARQQVHGDRRAPALGEDAEEARRAAVEAGDGLRAVGAHDPRRAARQQRPDEAERADVAEDLAAPVSVAVTVPSAAVVTSPP